MEGGALGRLEQWLSSWTLFPSTRAAAMNGVYGSPGRYFRQDTLLFTLSKWQRDFLASPPERLVAEADRHVRRTASILAQNGLIDLSGDPEPRVTLTHAGQAAISFYDTLRALGANQWTTVPRPRT